MDKINICSAFFDFSFTVYDPEIRKLFGNDLKYDNINKEFVKEIKNAVRKYKNQAKKYLMKKGENNVKINKKIQKS